MRNTADVTSGKAVVIGSQSILGVSAVNHLIAFYDIDRKKKEMQICSVPDTTRDSSGESLDFILIVLKLPLVWILWCEIYVV
jgi:hypothetical protein